MDKVLRYKKNNMSDILFFFNFRVDQALHSKAVKNRNKNWKNSDQWKDIWDEMVIFLIHFQNKN